MHDEDRHPLFLPPSGGAGLRVKPGDSCAVLDTVQEVFVSCKGEVDGADLPAPPTKPITFSALVKQLETEGLLKATSTTPKPKVIKPDPDSTLGPQHRAEVLLLDLF